MHRTVDNFNVAFTFQTNNMILSKIYLNYIVFNSKKSGFHSYGLSFTVENFLSTKVYNFQNKFYRSPYSMFGLIQLQMDPSVNFHFNPSLSDDFYLRIDSTKEI